MSTNINFVNSLGLGNNTRVDFNLPRTVLLKGEGRAVADGGVAEAELCSYNTLNGLNYNALLRSASFLLTPNIYKEGKLYSVIPSNGNGDFTVTRATTATRTNPQGLVEVVPYNLLTWSEMFSDALWIKNATSVTANTTTAPNGTLTADTLTELTTTSFHGINQSLTLNANKYTFSFYAKPNGRNFIQWNNSVLSDYVNFNISTGAIGNSQNVTNATTENVGNGWYKCSFEYTATSATGTWFRLTLITSATSARLENYLGDGTSGAFIWGAQIVEGTLPLVYLRTETRLNIPRVDYSLGSCPNLLLEPQRTNIALRSEEFDNAYWQKSASLTANTDISPSGVQNADTFTDSSAVSYLDVRTSAIIITPNATYTTSFFVKKTTGVTTHYPGIGILLAGVATRLDFGIINTNTGQVVRDSSSSINVATYSSQSFGNYWRFIVTFTDNVSNTSFALYLYPAISTNGTSISQNAQGSNVFWGAQLEAGAYSTSYIPTTTASVTRNTDSISLSNVFTNGLISASGGTWFVEIRNNIPYARDAFTLGISLLTTSGADGFYILVAGPTAAFLGIRKRISNIETALALFTTPTVKVAVKWNGTTADVFVNGIKVVTSTAFPTTLLQNINGNAGDVPKNINEMALWATPLTDDQLELLTGDSFNTYAEMASFYNYTLQ